MKNSKIMTTFKNRYIMYTVALYDKFNTEIIKEIKNESEILAECVFDTWLKDDACHGETLKMYDGEKTIKEIVIRKPFN